MPLGVPTPYFGDKHRGAGMTFGEWKSFVLQLIDQYSACGTELDADYNDQADFIVKLPGLFNDAMVKLASDPAPLLDVMHPEQMVPDYDWTQSGGFVTITHLPSDFLRMTGDGLPVIRGGTMTREKGYWMAGRNSLRVRADIFRAAMGEDHFNHAVLEYYRSPRRLPENPDDNIGLDGDTEMQTAAAYYAAAMLMLHEDAFVYAALKNEYEDRVNQMKKRMYAETFSVTPAVSIGYDVY